MFRRKKEVDLKEYCRDFYDSNILSASIGGIDAMEVFSRTVRESIVKEDNRFSAVGEEEFNFEFKTIRFVVFGLAWEHRFGHEKSILQSIFTKKYLGEKDKTDIWENTADYSAAIGRSSTIGRSADRPADRMHIVKVDKTKMDLFSHYRGVHTDSDDCIARALNRLYTKDVWKRGLTAGLIMFAMCDKLKFDKEFQPSKGAQHAITTTIIGLYNGAKQELDGIKLIK